MRCRPATPSDAAAIAAIGREAFPPTYAGSLDAKVIGTVVDALYTDQAVAADIRAAESNPDSRFLVTATDAVESEDLAGGFARIDGFLHYDELGPEPELHRIYLRPSAIGTGAGSALMAALHQSLSPDRRYVLLVATANTRAVAFYRRHGLEVRESVDGVEHYRTHMGVDIDESALPYPAFIMQRHPPRAAR